MLFGSFESAKICKKSNLLRGGEINCAHELPSAAAKLVIKLLKLAGQPRALRLVWPTVTDRGPTPGPVHGPMLLYEIWLVFYARLL